MIRTGGESLPVNPPYPNGPTTPGDVYVSPGVWSVRVEGRRARYTMGTRAHRSRTTI